MDHTSYDIFVSYSSKDRVWVTNYVQALQACGFSVWWDRSLRAGRSYHKDIQSALDHSRCVVTIWSKNAVDSQWVLAESEQAHKRGVIVPVSCSSARIPLPFTSLHTIDMSQWNGEINDLCFQRSLFAIRQTLDDSVSSSYLNNVSNIKKRGIKRRGHLSLVIIIVVLIFTLMKMPFTSLLNAKGDLSLDTLAVDKAKDPVTSIYSNLGGSEKDIQMVGAETKRLSDTSYSPTVQAKKDSVLEEIESSVEHKETLFPAEYEDTMLKWPSAIDLLAKDIDVTSEQQAKRLNRAWIYGLRGDISQKTYMVTPVENFSRYKSVTTGEISYVDRSNPSRVIKKSISLERYSENLRVLLEDLLVNLGVEMIERKLINQWVAESGLTEKQYFVSKENALATGKMTEDTSLVRGAILSCQFKKNKLRVYGLYQDLDMSTCKIRVRVVDLESGNIIFSRVVIGRSTLVASSEEDIELNSSILSAFEDGVEKLSQDIKFLDLLSK